MEIEVTVGKKQNSGTKPAVTPFPLVWRASKQDSIDLSEFIVLSWTSVPHGACFI